MFSYKVLVGELCHSKDAQAISDLYEWDGTSVIRFFEKNAGRDDEVCNVSMKIGAEGGKSIEISISDEDIKGVHDLLALIIERNRIRAEAHERWVAADGK